MQKSVCSYQRGCCRSGAARRAPRAPLLIMYIYVFSCCSELINEQQFARLFMCSVQFGVTCPVCCAAEAHSSIVFRVIRTRSVLRRWARAIPLSWKRTRRAGKVALGFSFAYLCLEVRNCEIDGLTCPQNYLKSWVDAQAGGTYLTTTFSLWRNRDSIHSAGTNIQELEREMVHLIIHILQICN
jgi:hypothetical protein